MVAFNGTPFNLSDEPVVTTGVKRIVGFDEAGNVVQSSLDDMVMDRPIAVSGAAAMVGMDADGNIIRIGSPMAATMVWSGAVTPNSFTVAGDLPGPATMKLIVSIYPDLSLPVFQSNDVTVENTPGVTASHYPFKITATGLSPNTLYYYGFTIDGAMQTPGYSCRTFPASGSAASFSFAFASCTTGFSAGFPDAILPAIAAEDPVLFVHLGDIAYPNVRYADPRIQRDTNTRVFRSFPSAGGLLSAVPIAYTFSDHDSADDDNHYDLTYTSGFTNSQIVTATRQVIDETVPHYAFPDTRVIAQQWDIGRCRFIMPDLYSQNIRATVTDAATTFGTGTLPPSSYNQWQWLLNALDDAVSDGIKIVFLMIAKTWTGAVFDSMAKHNANEQEALCNYIKDLGVAVVLCTGDCHQGGLDDGTNTDKSTNNDCRFPQIVSSGLYQQGYFKLAGPFTVLGEEREVEGNATLFAMVDVVDNGGTDITWQARILAGPVIDGSATQYATLASDEADVEVSLTDDDLYALSGGIEIFKSWFGPVANSGGVSCSVNWATDLGESGTIQFGPNVHRAIIPVTLPATEGDVAVTLSSPSRCLIGGSAIKTFTALDGDPKTIAYLAKMTVLPNSTRQGVIDTFIQSLVDNDLWDKLAYLKLRAAHDEQAARINVVRPGVNTDTVVGAPVFLTDRYYKGTGGAGNYLDTNFSMGGLPKDDASMGVYMRTSASSSNTSFGASFDSINPLASGLVRFRMSSNVTATVANSDGSGLISTVRDNSGSVKVYRNASLLGNISSLSTEHSGINLWSGAWNSGDASQNQYDNREIAAEFVARTALSATDIGNLYAAMHTYLAAVGAVA